MVLDISVLVPPFTGTNQFFAISWEFLLTFQNRNSSIEPLNLPAPAKLEGTPAVPEGAVKSPPMRACIFLDCSSFKVMEE